MYENHKLCPNCLKMNCGNYKTCLKYFSYLIRTGWTKMSELEEENKKLKTEILYLKGAK